jgi:hypothetical protein
MGLALKHVTSHIKICVLSADLVTFVVGNIGVRICTADRNPLLNTTLNRSIKLYTLCDKICDPGTVKMGLEGGFTLRHLF